MLIGDMDIAKLMVYVQQQKQKRRAPSSATTPAPRNQGEYNGQNSHNFRARPAQSQGSVAQRVNPPACAKCRRTHPVAPPDRDAPRGSTSGNGGGANHLYAITSRQEQENFLDVVTGMIKVFTLDFYDLLEKGASLSFMTPYVANNIDVLREKLCEPFCVSGEGIKVDTQKIEAVQNWPRPTSSTDIKSFLGLAGYYRRFVEGFSLFHLL
ncbi:hypothetical protein MTR67_034744 [Solanum verrucosum]|uniref:Gag-pol polyprotein n=1 Tax=Solanum verrucosum TaxID=315347 RepID=A0AAF0ZLL8_SOLVR|nr:hypothetical protein MTR67_034744 [Solanum verrucosum]